MNEKEIIKSNTNDKKDLLNPFRLLFKTYKLDKYSFGLHNDINDYKNTIGGNSAGENIHILISNNINSIDISPHKLEIHYNLSEVLEDFSTYGNLLLKSYIDFNMFPLLYVNKKETLEFSALPINTQYFTNINFQQCLDTSSTIIIQLCQKYGFPFDYNQTGDDENHNCYTYIESNNIIHLCHQLVIFHLLYSFHSLFIVLKNNRLSKYKDEFDRDEYYENILLPNINKFNELCKHLFSSKRINIKIDCENYNHKSFLQKLDKIYIEYRKLVNHYCDLFISCNLPAPTASLNDDNCICYSSNNLFALVWHSFINHLSTQMKPDKIHFCEICGCLIEQTGPKKPTRCTKHINIGKQNKTDTKKKNLCNQILNTISQFDDKDYSLKTYKNILNSALNSSSKLRRLWLEILDEISKKLKDSNLKSININGLLQILKPLEKYK